MASPADALTTLRHGLAQLEELIGSVGEDDLERATPCSEWTVGELVAHVVDGTGRFAAVVRGEEVDWTEPVPDVEGDRAEAFHTRAEQLLEAWSKHEPSQQNSPAWQLAEIAVHTYDLATALGRDTSQLDPQVADTGRGFMEANLTDERRGEAFGPRQDPRQDADAYQRIAAFAGRSV